VVFSWSAMRLSRAFRSSLVKLPFERGCDLFVVLLEVEQAGLDLVERVEVVGRDDFTLHDGEVDLHLIEPGRAHRKVNQAQSGPAMLEPVDADLTAMGGAVVDYPEHPTRGRVGLGGHDLVDQPVERVDAGGGFAAAEHLGAVDVPGSQVGQGAAAQVLRLDARRLVRCRGCGGVFADAGLDGGLLVGGDDVLGDRRGRAPGPPWVRSRGRGGRSRTGVARA